MRDLLLTLLLSGLTLSAMAGERIATAATMQEARLSLYPNPAKDHISVRGAGAYRIELMNMIGEVVINEQIINGTVTISDLQPGIYIVRVYDADGTLTGSSKLTKQ